MWNMGVLLLWLYNVVLYIYTHKYRFGPLVIGIPSPSSGRVNNFEPLPSDRKMWRSFCIKYSTAVKTEIFRSPWEASPCLQCSLLVLANPFKKNEVRNCWGCASFRALVITCRQMSEAWVAPQSYWVLVFKTCHNRWLEQKATDCSDGFGDQPFGYESKP